jgi:hypothetical protein
MPTLRFAIIDPYTGYFCLQRTSGNTNMRPMPGSSVGCRTIRSRNSSSSGSLSTRIHRGEVDGADGEQETVIELSQRLFRDACGPLALHLQRKLAESIPDGDTIRISDDSVDEDHPMRLVNRLQGTGAGCQWLLDLVGRTTELLHQKADVFRGLAELDAAYAADRLLWDDTDEGERLRRYELTCNRTLLRMFELLLKVCRTGEELDIATIPSIGRSAPSSLIAAIDKSAPAVATVITPPVEPVNEPDPPIEANPVRENAPIEAILMFRRSDQ